MILIAVIVVGVMIYRGWFNLSSGRETQTNQVDVNLPIDPDNAREDVETAEDKPTSRTDL